VGASGESAEQSAAEIVSLLEARAILTRAPS
jgi:hypothetical protein